MIFQAKSQRHKWTKRIAKKSKQKGLSIIVIKEVLAKYISQISDDYFYADFEKKKSPVNAKFKAEKSSRYTNIIQKGELVKIHCQAENDNQTSNLHLDVCVLLLILNH